MCAKLDALAPAQHEHIDLHTLQIYRNNVFLFSAGHCYIWNIITEVWFCCCQTGYPGEIQVFSQNCSRGNVLSIDYKIMIVMVLL